MMSRFRSIAKRLLPRLLLLAISLGVSILLAEVLVRIVAPQPLSGSWRVATSKGLMVNKSSGKSRHQFGDRIVDYRFYPPHLRDTPRSPDGTEILLLGDSFTFGWLLNREQTYVHHLQRYADGAFGRGKVTLLNAAAGGWGTAHCVAYLEEFGDVIEPAAVLVFLSADDIGRSIKSRLYRFSDSASLDLVHQKLPVSRLKRLMNSTPGYQFLLEHSHLLQILRRSAVAILHPKAKPSRPESGAAAIDQATIHAPSSEDLSGRSEEAVRMGNALFLRLQAWCKQRGVRLYVTTTGRHDPRRRAESSEPTVAFMSQAAELFKEARIPFHDISPSFFAIPPAQREAHSIEGDGHPSPSGSTFIADQVWEQFLKDQIAHLLSRSGDGGPFDE